MSRARHTPTHRGALILTHSFALFSGQTCTLDSKHSSGALLSVKAGAVIDAHDLVLRYNDAPTKGYEESVGRKTTWRLLNRKHVDSLVARLTNTHTLTHAHTHTHTHKY